MSSPLRYGLIGTGMMGLEHQRNLYGIAGVEVVAAAEVRANDAQTLALQPVLVEVVRIRDRHRWLGP